MPKNATVEELSNQGHRESFTGAPAVETFNARVRDVGAFRQDNVAISQAGVAIPYQSVDAASFTSFVAPRKGKIIGLTWQSSAAFTAGIGTLSPTIAGTIVGTPTTIVATPATSAVASFATPVPFAKGDKLGIKITTDANLLPAGTAELAAELVVRYDADDS